MAVDALPLDAELSRRWQRTAVLFGGAGLALVAIGWLVDRPGFERPIRLSVGEEIARLVGIVMRRLLGHLLAVATAEQNNDDQKHMGAMPTALRGHGTT